MEIITQSFSDLKQVTDEALESSSLSWDPIFIGKDGKPEVILLNYQAYDALLACIKDLILITKTELPSDQKIISLVQFIKTAKEAAIRLKEFEEAYLKLLLCLSSTMDSHEAYLSGHSQRLAILACDTARKLGCSEDEITDIRNAALLHDIGEVIIPDYVLEKPGKLTIDDWNIIKEHPRVGAEFVAEVKNLENVAKIIYTHHEKFDGTGYPNSLKGEAIPLGARILQVVDAYDAMTNLRTHREATNHQGAEAEIRRVSGTLFDPTVVDAFLNLF